MGEVAAGAAAWALTVALHLVALGAAAAALERALPRADAGARELLWRIVLLGSFATASLQLVAGIDPVAGTLHTLADGPLDAHLLRHAGAIAEAAKLDNGCARLLVADGDTVERLIAGHSPPLPAGGLGLNHGPLAAIEAVELLKEGPPPLSWYRSAGLARHTCLFSCSFARSSCPRCASKVWSKSYTCRARGGP